jgi:RND superfamily putative drug exporter
VLLGAVLVLAAALPLAAMEQDHLQPGDLIDSNSQSANVSNALAAGIFRGAQLGEMAVLLEPRATARNGDLAAAIHRVGTQIARVGGVQLRGTERSAALASAGADPHTPVVMPIDYGGGIGIEQARKVMDALAIHDPKPASVAAGRVTVHLIGEGALWAAFISRAYHDTKTGEALGIPIVAVVLLLVFGSVFAALLPIVLGVVAIVVTAAVIYLLSLATDMSIFAATTSAMVGLGVAIDYSLFILVRYREEVRAGLSFAEAGARAMATSGRAVVYSGLTVACALSALFLIPSPGIRSIAGATIIVVAAAVLLAIALLPVLIAKLGRRASEPGYLRRRITRLPDGRANGPGFWSRWTDVVIGHPGPSLVGAIVLLLAAAAPTLGLTVRNSAVSQLPRDDQVRLGMDLVARAQGPGALGPLQVIVNGPNRTAIAAATITRVSAAIRRDPAVQTVDAIRRSATGKLALITATLRVDPESPAARGAVDRLRAALPRVADGARIDVGGTTATLLDFDRLVTRQLWRPVLFVLTTACLILLVLLRSPVLALKAALMNLLSVLATYGLLTAVFQDGLLSFLGVHKAVAIYPITLPLVLTLASGLSMDYHIFMLSRIRERYLASGDTRKAVSEALASSASAISSAALIMVTVLLAFVTVGSPSIQQLGFALALVVAIDATIVRLVVVPTGMVLLGDWNWWLPGPLRRALPAVPAIDIEH